jgi:hypothetical protein
MDQSDKKNYVQSEHDYFAGIEDYFQQSSSTYSEKMHAFPRFVSRQAISYFLARNEIFKQIVPMHGSILDFGVYRGASLFSWHQLSAIYEPYNHLRKIIGFDSFTGFSEINDQDIAATDSKLSLKQQGAMTFAGGAEELARGIVLCDLNRPLGHVAKVHIEVGALPESVDKYLGEHPETVVALANFGLGLYAPTKAILERIKPRLQRGSILLFEELNQAMWPGETQALFEVFGAGNVHLQRVPYCPHLSWMTVEGGVS